MYHAPMGERGLTRLIGAEVEISEGHECPEIAQWCARWRANVVDDGSLPSTGSEIVTQPAGGTTWRDMVHELGRALTAADAAVTDACGLHIHIDASDLGPWEVRRLIQVYAAAEPALFACVPAARRGSQFCTPCGPQLLRTIEAPGRALKQKMLGRYVNPRAEIADKWHTSRYQALNLHSYWYRGTVEFRLGAGTTKTLKIMHWGFVCAALVEFAARHSQAEVDATLAVYADPWVLLKHVVGRMADPDTLAWLVARKERFE